MKFVICLLLRCSKTQCRLGVGRIKIARNKRQLSVRSATAASPLQCRSGAALCPRLPLLLLPQMQKLRREVAELMRQNKQSNARIRWARRCNLLECIAFPSKANRRLPSAPQQKHPRLPSTHAAHTACPPPPHHCSVEAVMREFHMLQVRRRSVLPRCFPPSLAPRGRFKPCAGVCVGGLGPRVACLSVPPPVPPSPHCLPSYRPHRTAPSCTAGL